MKKDYLVVNKVLYPKRKGSNLDNDWIRDALELEVQYHLNKHPELVFVKAGKAVKNTDLSQTIPLIFKPRVNEPKS